MKESEIIIRLKDENKKLRDALHPFAAWPIVANGRIVDTDKNWNELITAARAALT